MTKDGQSDLASLRRTAETNRDRVLGQLRRTRERLAPGRLTADARGFAVGQVKSVRDDTIAHVRQHPVRTALGVGLIVAWLSRKPLLARAPAAIAAVYRWSSGHAAFTQSSLSDANEPDDQAQAPSEGSASPADGQTMRTET